METNVSDGNNLDSEVLLPPRKRLLAGLKKQNSEVDGASDVSLPANPPIDVNARLNNLLGSNVSNRNLSHDEITEVSRSAAIAAAKAAEAARAAKALAEEKAAIAVKAIAAARTALDLVASFSEDAGSKERSPRRSKLKKHVPVQQLYKKHQTMDNNRVDEELARKLHRAINSSPRICKNIGPDLKSSKNKKPKVSHSERSRISNGGIMLEGGSYSMSNGHTKPGEMGSEGSNREIFTDNADGKVSECGKSRQLGNGEAEGSNSREKHVEDACVNGKKKGRVKLKKLPLSICNNKDRAYPKKKLDGKHSHSAEKKKSSSTVINVPLISQGKADSVMPVEAASTWKCQDYKATACFKQNKVVQS